MSAAPPTLRLRTFGSLDLRAADGHVIQSILAGPKRVAILTYLIAHAETGMLRRDHLVGIFWPDSDQDAARHSLRSCLHVLRRGLGDDVLVTRGDDEIGVGVGRFWCDAVEFPRLLKSGDCEGALSIYTGPFLAAFHLPDAPEFDQWASSQRAAFHRDAATAAAELAESSTDGRTAASWARRAVNLAPTEERYTRVLMLSLEDLGEKGEALQAYEQLRKVLAAELHAEPSPLTAQLAERLRTIRTSADLPVVLVGKDEGQPLPVELPPTRRERTPRAGALPSPATPFVGRTSEVGLVTDLLREHRLVTVFGFGGVGKTRLVIEVAGRSEPVFEDGVRFVPLAPVERPELLSSTIATALGLHLTGERSADSELLMFLRSHDLLLVLDNFEHLMGGAHLIAAMLETAPKVRILISSRERLNLFPEAAFELQGLGVPDIEAGAAEAVRSDAMHLFLQTAARAQPGFSPTASDCEAISAICRQLDGNALGIELAAGWVRLLSCEEIAQELTRDSGALENPRAEPPRHRGLKATFSYSWALLTDSERMTLENLSVFRGSFTRGGAQAVTGATTETLAALNDKALLRRLASSRLKMVEMLRQYGEEILIAYPDRHEQVHDEHARYFLLRLAGMELEVERHHRTVIAEIRDEIDDIRRAWMRGVQRGLTESLIAAARTLFLLFDSLNYYREGFESFAAAAVAVTDSEPRVRGSMLLYHGIFALRLTHYTEARELLSSAANTLLKCGELSGHAHAVHRLGTIAMETGDLPAAANHYRRSLDILRKVGTLREAANVLMHLGNVAYYAGRLAEAEEIYCETLVLQRRCSDHPGVALSLSNLACTSVDLNQIAKAREYLIEASEYFEEAGDKANVARCLHNRSVLEMREGHHELAERLARESLFVSKGLGLRRMQAFTQCLQGSIARACGDYDSACRYFIVSFHDALELGALPPALDAAEGLARIAKERGNVDFAKRVAYAVALHPSTAAADREAAISLLKELNPDATFDMEAGQDPRLLALCVDEILQFGGQD